MTGSYGQREEAMLEKWKIDSYHLGMADLFARIKKPRCRRWECQCVGREIQWAWWRWFRGFPRVLMGDIQARIEFQSVVCIKNMSSPLPPPATDDDDKQRGSQGTEAN